MSNPAEQQAPKTPAKRPAEPRNDENKRPPKFRARPRSYQGTENKLYNFNAETLATHTPEAFDKLLGSFADLNHDEAVPFFSPISSKQKWYLDSSSITNQERRATGLSLRKNLERLNENMEALKAQREQEKIEFRALKDKVEWLSSENVNLHKVCRELRSDNANLHKETRELRSDHANLHTKTRELRLDNANLHKETRELRSDNATLRKDYERIYSQVNFLEEREFPVVCGEIINCAYILLGRSHMSKLPKYEFLCMIYKKLDEAYDYDRLFLPDLKMAQFQCMVAQLDSAAPASHARARNDAVHKASISSANYYASQEEYLKLWVQACAVGEPEDRTLDVAASKKQAKSAHHPFLAYVSGKVMKSSSIQPEDLLATIEDGDEGFKDRIARALNLRG